MTLNQYIFWGCAIAGLVWYVWFASKREAFYAGAVLLGVGCVGFLLMICKSQDARNVGQNLILALACGIGAKIVYNKAEAVLEKEKTDTALQTEIEREKNALQIEKTRSAYIEPEAKKRVSNLHGELKTSGMAEEAKQETIRIGVKEIQSREGLIEAAAKTGMRPDDVADVNKAQANSDIELEERWKKIIQDSNAADLVLIGDYLAVKKLRQELREAREERYAIETSKRPKKLKQQLLADCDGGIASLEAKINERESRIPGRLLPQNGQTSGIPLTGAPDSGTEYPAAIDADDI